ncbi:MAG: substrate-binding domain-containing protein [Deltaproteobacteria bacterium]|jgi:ribose transport system substrate-binding protein/inositol transport system substrate-binding protein|nr:substrate-binding domain-containing protein [Deltaproteobacteria bacterium]
MRRVLLFAAALALVLAIGSPGAMAQDKKEITIGSTVYYMTEFITLMVEGMKAEAEELGVKLTILDANNDASVQLNQVENLIASKVDVILVAAVDADAIVPALDMAQAAGIPLTGVNMLINTDRSYYYAGPNDVEAGELEAQYVVDAIGGKGNVVILEGPIGTSAQLDRLEGNLNVLKKYPDVKILAQKPANWNREQALSTMENWLQTYPDQINGVISHNDEMALGAIQAMEAKGVKLPVGSVDAIKDACQAIKDGRLDATVFQDAHLEGRLGVRVAYQVVTGNPPEKEINFIKMELITKDNVDKLLDTIYK